MLLHSDRHRGRVALVTGAASGIGRAVALRLAREGADVVAVDLHREPLEAVLAEMGADAGRSVAVVADVSDRGDAERAVAAAEDLGGLGLLVNNAGIMDGFLPAHEVDDDTWRRVMAVNVDGPMLFTRAALPAMTARGAGAVVNVASVGGLRGGAAGAAYTVSKHALVGLTRSVAWTYRAAGVRCNVVCPGGVSTGIDAAPRSAWGLERLGAVHAGAVRMAEPDEIATLVSWLGCEEASNVNGAVVAADGGWTAG
jgi:NAD(P)-dependent dehydrogenase (short-subunit alcohol dehydrogenase family)